MQVAKIAQNLHFWDISVDVIGFACPFALQLLNHDRQARLPFFAFVFLFLTHRPHSPASGLVN
jgi:hypothetical protein